MGLTPAGTGDTESPEMLAGPPAVGYPPSPPHGVGKSVQFRRWPATVIGRATPNATGETWEGGEADDREPGNLAVREALGAPCPIPGAGIQRPRGFVSAIRAF